ncbi:hypothetical protein GCM10022627_33150 [Haloarcula argentinensis]
MQSINTELEVIDERHDVHEHLLESTEDRWNREDAESHVDNFIEFDVGRDWDPDPDNVSLQDAFEAMITHRDLSRDQITEYHTEVLENRWEELISELTPDRGLGSVPVDTSEYDAANMVIEALWNIYDREKYDMNENMYLEFKKDLEQLQKERENLIEEFEASDPQQLKESLKWTVFPILFSVSSPILYSLLHQTGLTLRTPDVFTIIEPVVITLIWLVGLVSSLYFLWRKISETQNSIPESPIDSGEAENSSN